MHEVEGVTAEHRFSAYRFGVGWTACQCVLTPGVDEQGLVTECAPSGQGVCEQTSEVCLVRSTIQQAGVICSVEVGPTIENT